MARIILTRVIKDSKRAKAFKIGNYYAFHPYTITDWNINDRAHGCAALYVRNIIYSSIMDLKSNFKRIKEDDSEFTGWRVYLFKGAEVILDADFMGKHAFSERMGDYKKKIIIEVDNIDEWAMNNIIYSAKYPCRNFNPIWFIGR